MAESLTLRQLADELLALDELLEETEGEVTPEIEAWMDEYGKKLVGKADAIGDYISHSEGRVWVLATEEKRLAKTRKQVEKKLEWLRGHWANALAASGRKKIEGDRFALSVKANRSVVLTALAQDLPSQFVRLVPASVEPDKGKIALALKSDNAETVSMVEKFAKLATSYTLTIK